MEAEDMQELKVRFYKLMVEYDMHEKDPFSLCRFVEHLESLS
jgi:hypothetical protein